MRECTEKGLRSCKMLVDVGERDIVYTEIVTCHDACRALITWMPVRASIICQRQHHLEATIVRQHEYSTYPLSKQAVVLLIFQRAGFGWNLVVNYIVVEMTTSASPCSLLCTERAIAADYSLFVARGTWTAGQSRKLNASSTHLDFVACGYYCVFTGELRAANTRQLWQAP